MYSKSTINPVRFIVKNPNIPELFECKIDFINPALPSLKSYKEKDLPDIANNLKNAGHIPQDQKDLLLDTIARNPKKLSIKIQKINQYCIIYNTFTGMPEDASTFWERNDTNHKIPNENNRLIRDNFLCHYSDSKNVDILKSTTQCDDLDMLMEMEEGEGTVKFKIYDLQQGDYLPKNAIPLMHFSEEESALILKEKNIATAVFKRKLGTLLQTLFNMISEHPVISAFVMTLFIALAIAMMVNPATAMVMVSPFSMAMTRKAPAVNTWNVSQNIPIHEASLKRNLLSSVSRPPKFPSLIPITTPINGPTKVHDELFSNVLTICQKPAHGALLRAENDVAFQLYQSIMQENYENFYSIMDRNNPSISPLWEKKLVSSIIVAGNIRNQDKIQMLETLLYTQHSHEIFRNYCNSAIRQNNLTLFRYFRFKMTMIYPESKIEEEFANDKFLSYSILYNAMNISKNVMQSGASFIPDYLNSSSLQYDLRIPFSLIIKANNLQFLQWALEHGLSKKTLENSFNKIIQACIRDKAWDVALRTTVEVGIEGRKGTKKVTHQSNDAETDSLFVKMINYYNYMGYINTLEKTQHYSAFDYFIYQKIQHLKEEKNLLKFNKDFEKLARESTYDKFELAKYIFLKNTYIHIIYIAFASAFIAHHYVKKFLISRIHLHGILNKIEHLPGNNSQSKDRIGKIEEQWNFEKNQLEQKITKSLSLVFDLGDTSFLFEEKFSISNKQFRLAPNIESFGPFQNIVFTHKTMKQCILEIFKSVAGDNPLSEWKKIAENMDRVIIQITKNILENSDEYKNYLIFQNNSSISNKIKKMVLQKEQANALFDKCVELFSSIKAAPTEFQNIMLPLFKQANRIDLEKLSYCEDIQDPLLFNTAESKKIDYLISQAHDYLSRNKKPVTPTQGNIRIKPSSDKKSKHISKAPTTHSLFYGSKSQLPAPAADKKEHRKDHENNEIPLSIFLKLKEIDFPMKEVETSSKTKSAEKSPSIPSGNQHIAIILGTLDLLKNLIGDDTWYFKHSAHQLLSKIADLLSDFFQKNPVILTTETTLEMLPFLRNNLLHHSECFFNLPNGTICNYIRRFEMCFRPLFDSLLATGSYEKLVILKADDEDILFKKPLWIDQKPLMSILTRLQIWCSNTQKCLTLALKKDQKYLYEKDKILQSAMLSLLLQHREIRTELNKHFIKTNVMYSFELSEFINTIAHESINQTQGVSSYELTLQGEIGHRQIMSHLKMVNTQIPAIEKEILGSFKSCIEVTELGDNQGMKL